MTRINVSIPPAELVMQHLLAEHREMVRIPNAITSGRANLSNIPSKFTLGPGHVKFFYDKQLFLRNRYDAVYLECIKRGYNVKCYRDAWDNVPAHLMNDYTPTPADDVIIRQRIKERLQDMGLS